MTSLSSAKTSGVNGGNGQIADEEIAAGLDGGFSPSPFAGWAWGAALAMLYPLVLITPLGIFVIMHPASDRWPIAEAGAECAVVGFTILAMQFVIGARLRWIEAPFGLDVLLVLHKLMALVATGLLLAHPLLVAWGESWSLLTRVHARWYFWAGRAAALILILHIGVSLGRLVMRLSYERWRRVHNVSALSILSLGFAHSAAIGQDTRGGGLVVWSMPAAVAIGCWIHHRVLRPALLRRRVPFRVVGIVAEAPQVWTLTLRPVGHHRLRFVPGQFQFLRLFGEGMPSDEHPFTIASSPTRSRDVTVTVKECGDFTSQIARARPGDLATIHGPFGRFSHTLHPPTEELIFVAAGVGITPLMSMLRHMRDCRFSQRVLLIYASRSLKDVLFANELRDMEAGVCPMLKVIHVLSSPSACWDGETGRLDADRLVLLCGELKHKSFYVCCPSPMTAGLVRGLKRLGVKPRHIHTDYFSH
jgi:predicted ferric reductase